MKKNDLILLALALATVGVLVAGCTPEATKAATNVGLCFVTTAPAAITAASGTGSNAEKAVATSNVVLQAATTIQACADAPAAIQAAVAAGKTATVQPAVAAPPAPATPTK